ncbi:MAG: hypothetical protein ACI9EB_001835 [Pseudomonas sp.]|jgi:hypothetical protein
MDDRRQRSRHHAQLQLEVFDLSNEQCLGRIVDLTNDGFMLFSETTINADSVWDLRLVCAQSVEGVREIHLGADCLWSRPGADGQHCWSGFHIIDLADDQAAALATLLKHI